MTVQTTVRVATDWRADFGMWLRAERSEKTAAAYELDLKVFEGWWLAANGQTFEPGQMNSADVRVFRQWSLDVQRVKPATWNRRRATLKVLCEWIRVVLRLDVFQFGGRVIATAAEEEQAPRWLTGAEKRQVLRDGEIQIVGANTAERKLRALRDRGMVAMMLFAGLRVDEVANLLVGDVWVSERKGQVVVRQGKRGKRREVPLSSSVREAVGMFVEGKNLDKPLFADEAGQALSTRAIQKRVEAMAGRLGIEGLSCHALRHTFAKSLLDAGRPLTEVQQLLGHEKIETTARYVQPGREDLAEAVEAGELGKLSQLRRF